MGSGAYGVAAASLEYFDKSIKELNYVEAALISSTTKSPSKYNPYRDINLAKFRRDLVLNNLFENKFLNREVNYKNYKSQDIVLKKTKKVFLEDAQYYIEDVRKKYYRSINL